MKPRISKQWS